jgi:hypothetical protein
VGQFASARNYKIHECCMKSQIIPIAYQGGTYGTYLEWCLTSLTGTDQLVSPFTAVGNSHKFRGHFLNSSVLFSFLNTTQSTKFARFHPKTQTQHSMSNRLDQVCDIVQHMIYIYPDRDCVLLTINNYFTKIWDNW